MSTQRSQHQKSDSLGGWARSRSARGGQWLQRILTHLGNSASEGGVSEFLVHVDCFSSGQVSQNDAVVLDDASVLLVDLLD